MIFRLAELNIEYTPLYPSFEGFAGGYRCEGGEADLAVSCTPADIALEQERSDAEDRLEGNRPTVWSPEYLETLAVYRKIAEQAPFYNVFLFHGSVIAMDGEAYLFTAKSGTGKSTHTRLWRQQFGDRCVMINDDKPLLRVFPDNSIRAYGTPWDGKHHLSSNTSAPLKAICILTRDEYNHIERITAEEAYSRILQQIYRPADGNAFVQTLGLIDRLLAAVPVYRLGCNQEPEAARVSYEGMKQT